MNEVLVGLGIAYIFLAALLLLALVYGRMNWTVKLVLIVVSVGVLLAQLCQLAKRTGLAQSG